MNAQNQNIFLWKWKLMYVTITVTVGSAICKIAESKTYEKIIWDAKNFKSVIMTETYLRVLEQKYVRDVYCRFRLGISDLLVHKNTDSDTTRRIVRVQCKKQNLKVKSISC